MNNYTYIWLKDNKTKVDFCTLTIQNVDREIAQFLTVFVKDQRPSVKMPRKKKIKDPSIQPMFPVGSSAGREDREKLLARIKKIDDQAAQKIFVPFSVDMKQRTAAIELRTKGRHIVSGQPGQVPDFAELGCTLQLIEEDGEFVVRPATL